jgi:hypothetical protein
MLSDQVEHLIVLSSGAHPGADRYPSGGSDRLHPTPRRTELTTTPSQTPPTTNLTNTTADVLDPLRVFAAPEGRAFEP